MLKTAVLVSGGGTNLDAIFRAQDEGTIRDARVAIVIADRPCAALEKAEKRGVRTLLLERKVLKRRRFESEAIEAIRQEGCFLVVLAGFLSILSDDFISAFPDRIINIHPSLIPSFCGDGYYGLRVHEAALERGVKITGATVHLVNSITDGGRILNQKAVEVRQDDTPESLQQRVMREAEWIILPQTIQLLAEKTERGETI